MVADFFYRWRNLACNTYIKSQLCDAQRCDGWLLQRLSSLHLEDVSLLHPCGTSLDSWDCFSSSDSRLFHLYEHFGKKCKWWSPC